MIRVICHFCLMSRCQTGGSGHLDCNESAWSIASDYSPNPKREAQTPASPRLYSLSMFINQFQSQAGSPNPCKFMLIVVRCPLISVAIPSGKPKPLQADINK